MNSNSVKPITADPLSIKTDKRTLKPNSNRKRPYFISILLPFSLMQVRARAIFPKLCACLAYLVDVCLVLHLFCVVFLTNMSCE